nr:hypothetical protein BdHM001_18050 [Bdellovibrio sp. HM001]
MKSIVILFLAIIVLQNGYAKSGNLKIYTEQIFSHRLKMKPKSEFDKWNADQWSNAASVCAFEAQVKIPKEVNELPNLKSGSFRLPDDIEAFCRALAKGPSPQCFYLRSMIEPFQPPTAGLPADYVYMKKLVPEGTMVTVGGECNLVTNEFSTKQFFSGQAKVVWRLKPSLKSVQTFKGPRQLNMGNIWFDVEGMPGKENMPSSSAVIISN